jgi:hypothetical protein
MNKDVRKKRLDFLLNERKKSVEKLEKEKRIAEMLELFPRTVKIEILD